MSLGEIKAAIEGLSDRETAELEVFLRERLGKSPEGLRARWSAIMREMDSGKSVSFDKLKALHQAMEAVGM